MTQPPAVPSHWVQTAAAPPISDRLLGRARRFVRAHPYLAGSLLLHAALAAAWLHTPGLGEGARAHSLVAVAQTQARERSQTEARRLARFFRLGHTPGKMRVLPEARNPDFPFTLDLRTAV